MPGILISVDAAEGGVLCALFLCLLLVLAETASAAGSERWQRFASFLQAAILPLFVVFVVGIVVRVSDAL